MSSNLTKIDKEQLLQILKKHELWLNNDENGKEADFGNIDLSGLDLSNANLSYCTAWYASFDTCNLQNTNFTGSMLYGSSFENADCRNSSFKDCNIKRTKFNNAKLTGACFADVDGAYKALFDNVDVDESLIGEMYGKCFKSFGCKRCSENKLIL